MFKRDAGRAFFSGEKTDKGNGAVIGNPQKKFRAS